jgi:hypothetical protein
MTLSDTWTAAIKGQVTKGRMNADEKPVPRPRKGFASHLERVEIEPEALPDHMGKQKILIEEDVSERLDVVASRFRVIVKPVPRYASDQSCPRSSRLHLNLQGVHLQQKHVRADTLSFFAHICVVLPSHTQVQCQDGVFRHLSTGLIDVC